MVRKNYVLRKITFARERQNYFVAIQNTIKTHKIRCRTFVNGIDRLLSPDFRRNSEKRVKN